MSFDTKQARFVVAATLKECRDLRVRLDAIKMRDACDEIDRLRIDNQEQRDRLAKCGERDLLASEEIERLRREIAEVTNGTHAFHHPARRCARTSCGIEGATWFNKSTHLYYCGVCARQINDANAIDSFRLYGTYNLCEEEP